MQIIKEHRAFFVLYFTFLLLGGYLLIVYSKSSIHIYFNQYNNIAADYFFKYLTEFGDKWAVTFVGLFFLIFKSKRAALQIWLSGILGLILSQFMKHIIFGDTPRPAKYFTEIYPYNLHYVDGVEMLYINSMPSGHTTAAFAMFLSIALIYKKRQLDTAMFVLAFLIGVSRIYISQHFFEDVYMGSIVGVLSAITIYSWLYSPKNLENTNLSIPLYTK